MFILLIPIVFTFWAIMDLAHRDLGSTKKKFIWGIIVVLIPYLGGPVYLIFGRRQGKEKTLESDPNHRDKTDQSIVDSEQ